MRIHLTAIGILLLLISASQAATQAEIKQAVLNYNALQAGQQAVAAIVVDIKPGFHSQSHKPSEDFYIPFTAKLPADGPVKTYEPIYPAGQDHTYRVGKLNTYQGTVIIYVPLEVPADAKPGPVKLAGSVRWQICDEDKCYMPENNKFTIESSIVPAGQAVQTQYPELFKNFDAKVFSKLKAPTTAPAGASQTPPTQASSETSFFGLQIGKNSYALAFFAAFVAGITFNLVPCVLPVLPLKVIGFYNAAHQSRAKSLSFGAVFSAGIVACFGALALIVLVKNLGWGQLYSNPWVNLGLVLLLLAMAIGTFGFFTVNVPTALYNISPRHDTYWGNFLFGILTAILSTPCTFGLFLGLLVWAASQPRAVGVGLVMNVGLGMASPYLLLSAFPEAARKMPRGGPWGELFKQEMAFLLLGSAVFFARRFIEPVLGTDGFWWLLFAVAAIAGLYLLMRTFQFSANFTPRVIAGIICLLLIASSLALTLKLVNQPYTWATFSQTALSEARQSNRLVVVEFTAAWCTNCQYVETHTLHDPAVVRTVKQKNVQMLKADLTSETAPGWEKLKEINAVAAIPFTAVYGPGASEPIKLEGIYSAADLQAAIDRAANTPRAVAGI